uniref:Sugar phosphate isomerase/epimerase n=1 Tax=Fundidesulfovibrio putealis TaxID=270496 RepID=A0A7C4AHX9_9BACT
MFFVNLTLRAVKNDPDKLAAFLARGVNAELGMDPVLMDATDAAWHRDMAARLADAGVRAAVHLPFFDLQPGSADALIRRATRERLLRAADLAALYDPAHLVGHASYDPLLYVRSYDQWMERSLETWGAMLAAWPEHPPLHLENTFEFRPGMVTRLVEALRARCGPRVGICMDVGHWHSFAGGSARDDLDAWLDAFAPLVTHTHLHDNDGAADQHKGLGRGAIPWQAFFEGLAARGLTPSVTFEPHGEDAFTDSMEFVRANPHWFDRLGVRPPENGAG